MKRVALLIETSNAYARGLLQGIISYMREHGSWSVYLAEHGRGDRPPSWLGTWNGDGIIARVETPTIANALRQVKVPVVDVSASRLIPSLPWFETDDAAFAQLAAEHLIGRGFRQFAFCGDPHFNWSNWREEHFIRAIAGEGFPCSTYAPTRKFSKDDTAQVEDIASWIRKLPKPVGVMACYDLRGVQLLDACSRLGLAVPEEVAVIGADNDELLCELSHPPLSSVIPNTHRTGYEAAVLLDQLMEGAKGKSGATHLISPLGVATRQSTNILAIEDPSMAKALHFIRQNACTGIKVADVLTIVPLSRRMLENRFMKFIGRSPHEEIIRVRVERVRQLLTETKLSLADIAERTGFTHAEYLTVVFRNKTGLTPGKYRTLNRPQS